MTYETHVTSTILIVGAGPTGLTLAIELARRRISFRLIDAARGPFTGSRGKGVQPRTLEIFHHLGVIDEVLAAGGLCPRLRVHMGPLAFPAGSLGTYHAATAARPYPNLWIVPQAVTEGILRRRLSSEGGRVEYGVALQDLTQDASGVTATLSTGEQVKCAYLVGSDGGRSKVRSLIGLRLQGEQLGDTGRLVADLVVDGLSRDRWHVWPFGKGGMISICPLPRSDLFQLTAPAVMEQDGVEAGLRRRLGLRVQRVAWASTYRPQVRMVDRYRVGRVLLAGDAAHLHPPAGGQGLNTGVQDAWNLGWKLACAVRGGPQSILDSYEVERLPVAAAVLRLSKRLHLKSSTRRGELTNQLTLHYRDSPLSEGAPLGAWRAGARVDDLHLADGRRLFDALRETRVLQLVDPDGARVLVRPDGYIASIGRAAVTEYARERVEQVRCAAGSPRRHSSHSIW